MSYRIARRTGLLLIPGFFSIFRVAPAPAQQPAQTVPVELAVAFVRTYARPDSAATVEFLSGDSAPGESLHFVKMTAREQATCRSPQRISGDRRRAPCRPTART